MTIKEIEQLTGMSRANIRFYETEGLIMPRRKENGYRDYSLQDGETLLKIRLLRTMDMPLEEVKALHVGKESLGEALTRHLDTLTQKHTQLERSQLLARELITAGEVYAGLDALRYLRALEGQEEHLRGDVTPGYNLPWRRFWARELDMMLYGLLVSRLLRGFLLRESLTALLTLVAMLLLEPLLLYLLGTTPGKAIFGIRVTNTEEGRLSYTRGLERTWMAL